MNAPRLLPLIGVAVAGVLAINFLAGARDLPTLLAGAKANAESAQPPGGKGTKTAAKPAPASAASSSPASSSPGMAASPLPSGPSASTAPAVCSPNGAELAKSAGLSPGELQILQSLQERRSQIDQQAKAVDAQSALLSAAEAKLDAKLKAMGALKDQIQVLLGQADQRTQGEVDRLVVVYSKMPPKSAAPIMSQLDDKVRVPVAAAMKPAVLAAVLKEMAPADAKHLTELLAHRFSNVQQLADAARQPPAAPAPAGPAGKTASKPPADAKAQAKADGTAAPSPDDANVDDQRAKPTRAARHAKARPRRAAAKPVQQAASAGAKANGEAKTTPAAATAPAPKPAAATSPASSR